jgi:hypothetical protein
MSHSDKKHQKRPAALLSAGLALLLLAGCATGAKPKAMVPREFHITGHHAQSIAVTVTGGKKTNPMWKSEISSEDFDQAVRDSITQSGVFALAQTKVPADYALQVNLIKTLSPNAGFSLTVTLLAQWQLSDKAGKTLLDEYLSTPYTAEVGEAFVAVKRLRLAAEGAARENIKEGLRRLSEMQLPAEAAQSQR